MSKLLKIEAKFYLTNSNSNKKTVVIPFTFEEEDDVEYHFETVDNKKKLIFTKRGKAIRKLLDFLEQNNLTNHREIGFFWLESRFLDATSEKINTFLEKFD